MIMFGWLIGMKWIFIWIVYMICETKGIVLSLNIAWYIILL